MSLTDSIFFHLGTIGELFDSYLNESNPECIHFRASLGFTPYKSLGDDKSSELRKGGVILNSKIDFDTHSLNSKCIVEYCRFDGGQRIQLEIGEFCYLSNCALLEKEMKSKTVETTKLKVPENTCMHTVPVYVEDTLAIKFVCIFFDRFDDLKKQYNQLDTLRFLGKTNCSRLLAQIGVEPGESVSVWNIRVFQACDTMSEAFLSALEFVHKFRQDEEENEYFFSRKVSTVRLSLFDILRVNSFEHILAYRIENSLI